MKAYFALATVLFSSGAYAEQHPTHQNFRPVPIARPAVRIQVQRAKIQSANMDQRRDGARDIVGGTIELSASNGREVTLTLQPAFSCPRGRVCAEVMPHPITIRLPLTNVTRDNCGAVVYTATRDLRPVDGGMTTIEVRDNRNFRCPTFARMAATDVVLREIGPRASFNEERISTMFASPLLNALVDAPFPGGDPMITR